MTKEWGPDPDYVPGEHFSSWPWEDVTKTQRRVVLSLIAFFFTVLLLCGLYVLWLLVF